MTAEAGVSAASNARPLVVLKASQLALASWQLWSGDAAVKLSV
jgi:hypothetical protein